MGFALHTKRSQCHFSSPGYLLSIVVVYQPFLLLLSGSVVSLLDVRAVAWYGH